VNVPPVPDEVLRLFWDVDPASILFDRHSDYVLERVMTRGGWVAMKWLRATYGPEALADFLRRKGAALPPRERAYWGLVAGLRVEAGPGRSRPGWAGE